MARWINVGIFCALLGCLACSQPGTPERQEPEDSVMLPQVSETETLRFEKLSDVMGEISLIMKNLNSSDEAVQTESAEWLVKLAGVVKSERFRKDDQFAEYASSLGARATDFLATMKTGEKSEIESAIIEIKKVCQECHKQYR
jgi:cytochrome c556